MRMGKKITLSSISLLEKTHATLKSKKKKRFPMYVDHIQFLKQRAGWKVTNVHNCYTFKQKNFKKEFVLGNQRARQEAVAKNDNVQGNFYKLMNNSNFSYDCRDHSQNRNI